MKRPERRCGKMIHQVMEGRVPTLVYQSSSFGDGYSWQEEGPVAVAVITVVVKDGVLWSKAHEGL